MTNHTALPDHDDIALYRNDREEGEPLDRHADTRAALLEWAKAHEYRPGRFESFAWYGEPETPGQYMLHYYVNRDSTLLDQSNAAAMESALSPYTGSLDDNPPSDCEIQDHNHWACGWVRCFVIRLYRTDGELTDAALMLAELLARMANYPVLDEEDYTSWEMDATGAAVREVTSRIFNKYSDNPADLDAMTSDVWQWLDDNEPHETESTDDTGGYPSDEAVLRALIATRHLSPETETEA